MLTGLSPGPTSAALQAPLKLAQASLQEPRLFRVLDRPAVEQAAQKDAGGLELIHVLEDEDLHLSRPERDVGRARVAVDGGGIAAGEREVLQAVLGNERGVRQ